MKRKVLLRPESEGGYSASVPALPGCYSQGETREEALENIREAAELWLEVAADTADDRRLHSEHELVDDREDRIHGRGVELTEAILEVPFVLGTDLKDEGNGRHR